MNNFTDNDRKELFLQIVDKAIKNGYTPPYKLNDINNIEFISENAFEIFDNGLFTRYTIEEVIFSQDFAKAFWNDQSGKYLKNFGWKYNICNTVVQNNKLIYLKNFL